MSTPVPISVPARRLDPDSLSYLTRVERAAGEGEVGAFLRVPVPPAETDPGPLPALLIGLLLAGAALGVYALPTLPGGDVTGYAQAIGLALGLGLVLAAVLTPRRRVERAPFAGGFAWADALHLFRVTPDQVEAIPVADVLEAHASEHREARHYVHTDVYLKTRHGATRLRVRDHEAAERLVSFLTFHRHLREGENGRYRPMYEREPARFGALVQASARRGTLGLSMRVDPANLETGVTPPTPYAVGRDEPAAAPTAASRVLPWAVAAAALAGGLFLFPTVNGTLAEDRLFGRALAAAPGDAAPFELYLERYPEGRHAEAAREALEENLVAFALASPPGEEARFQAYHARKPPGPRAAEVEAGFEDNLAKHAVASPPGEEARFARYLERFPEGKNAAAVRAAREDNLFKFAAESPPGDDSRYEAFFRLVPDSPRWVAAAEARELHLRKAMEAAAEDDPAPAERYAAVFPKGPFGADALKARDNRRFRKAASLTVGDDPAPYRAYLADPANTRNRERAADRVAEMYDRAIRRTDAAKADPDARAAVAALLTALKTAGSSRVSVGFRSTANDAPIDDEAKLDEEAEERQLLLKYPGLKELAARRQTAILPRGSVFNQKHTARREGILFTRLRDTVGRAYSTKLIDLVPARAGETPALEFASRISPSGELGVYSSGSVPTGLLRNYQIDWVVTTRPPGTQDAHEFRLRSLPAQQWSYQPDHPDPDWAPYAIDLYSACYDMAGRFGRAFDVEPGPVPAAYTFAETSGD